MSGDRRYVGWMRQGLGAQARIAPDGQASTTLTLSYGAESDTVTLPLWGPGQVATVQPGFLSLRVPEAGSVNATPGSLAYVELADPYLPWALPFDDAKTPWLALLCVPADIARMDASAQPGPRIVFEGDASPFLPEPAVLRALAHAEIHGDRVTAARLLSATRLGAGVEYLCAVVPASAAGRAAGEGKDTTGVSGLAWGSDGPTSLPAFAHWRFRCGTLPSFEDVVARLNPVPDPGTRLSAVTSPDTVDILGLAAPEPVALRTVFAAPGDVLPPSAALSDAVAARLETRADRPEPLGLPAYGRSVRRSETVPWFGQLNADPSLRLCAGIGARLAGEHRDHIADFAAETVGAVDAANALLARARASRLARWRAWTRIEDMARRRPAELLGLLAPALRRTAHDAGDPFVARLARTAGAALVDPATRVALRADMARRAGGDGGRAWSSPDDAPDLATVLRDQIRAAARGRVPGGKLLRAPGRGFDGSETHRPKPAIDPLIPLEAMMDNVEPDRQDLPEEIGIARHEIEAEGVSHATATGRPPRLDDIAALAREAHAAFDPRVTVPRRIAARVTLHPSMGALSPDLTQIKWEPPWPAPLVDLLAAMSPDLVAPAAGRMKPGDVILLEADRTMIAALLVGANHAALADLRWRDFPVRSDMSPVRRVFPRPRIAGTTQEAFDAQPIRAWHTTLGQNLNGASGTAEPPKSVLLIRSPLFELYPQTVLYAARATRRDGALVPSGIESQRAFPVAFGTLSQGIAYVGFAIVPDDLAGRVGDGWFLIFQGPDEAGGFSLPATGPRPSWAAMGGDIVTAQGLGPSAEPSAAAQAMLDRPLTVALHAARLMKDTAP